MGTFSGPALPLGAEASAKTISTSSWIHQHIVEWIDGMMAESQPRSPPASAPCHESVTSGARARDEGEEGVGRGVIRNSLQLSTKPRRGRSNIHTQAPDLTNKSIIHSTTMKVSKRTMTALVSALMLGSGAIGMAKADCGFGFDNSCADDDHVQVGVWLCDDMDSCDCQPHT